MALQKSTSQVPLDSENSVKDSNPTPSDERECPFVIPEYLDSDDPAIADDGSKEWVEGQKNKRATRSLRLWWYQGRLLTAYHHLAGDESVPTAAVRIRPAEICRQLDVSAQAVSQWTQGTTVIAPENYQLLLRHFPESSEKNPKPSQYQLDCSGYRFAVTQLKRKLSDDPALEVIDEWLFWILWYLLRSRTWLDAESSEEAEFAASEIIRRVDETLRDCEIHFEAARLDCLNVDQLKQIVRDWGMTFVQVISELDDVCWTAPYV